MARRQRYHPTTALHSLADAWMECAHDVEGDEGGRRKRRLSERLAGDDNKGGRARNKQHNVGNSGWGVSRRVCGGMGSSRRRQCDREGRTLLHLGREERSASTGDASLQTA